MTKEQKNKFMKVVVTPRMKEVFQAYDATEYKVFGCKTCHGKDPKAVDFKMPSADLHVLPATREGFAELMQKEPKAMKFMAGEVKPKMAALLGLEDFRPDNPKPDAFGCHGCHTSKTQ